MSKYDQKWVKTAIAIQSLKYHLKLISENITKLVNRVKNICTGT